MRVDIMHDAGSYYTRDEENTPKSEPQYRKDYLEAKNPPS